MTSIDFEILLTECLLKFDGGLSLEETIIYGRKIFNERNKQFIRIDEKHPLINMSEKNKQVERENSNGINPGIPFNDSNERRYNNPEIIIDE